MKWEYKREYLGEIETANKLGEEGWELVAVVNCTGTFKRPLVEREKPLNEKKPLLVEKVYNLKIGDRVRCIQPYGNYLETNKEYIIKEFSGTETKTCKIEKDPNNWWNISRFELIEEEKSTPEPGTCVGVGTYVGTAYGIKIYSAPSEKESKEAFIEASPKLNFAHSHIGIEKGTADYMKKGNCFYSRLIASEEFIEGLKKYIKFDNEGPAKLDDILQEGNDVYA